jgi:hypothetical protein
MSFAMTATLDGQSARQRRGVMESDCGTCMVECAHDAARRRRRQARTALPPVKGRDSMWRNELKSSSFSLSHTEMLRATEPHGGVSLNVVQKIMEEG